MKHFFDDTIAAIATPLGIGGVGVVRVSGDQAVRLAGSIIKGFPKKVEPRRVYHGWIVDEGKLVDEALYHYEKAPASYTGEDVVEISGHGGTAVLRRILDLFIREGARLAERGEFTKRAFLNGKMDLLQAEAVLDLITAKTDRALGASVSQLEGRLSAEIRGIRQGLIELLAGIEAAIDFPDDVEDLGRANLVASSGGFLKRVEWLLESAGEGRVLREGIRTAVVGKPNVGKSSLLNALLGEGRAIVTEEAGTTRDTIEEVVNISGFPFVVVDTAGIRHPRDKAEEFGVERARRELEDADLVLIVIDASAELTAEDYVVLEAARKRRGIIVLNKIDLGFRVALNGYGENSWQVKISALKGEGMGELKELILTCLGAEKSREAGGPGPVNSRHKECLLRAREAILQASEAIRRNKPADFVSIDLKAAIVALGEISGEEASEEVVDAIFERFCVGK